MRPADDGASIVTADVELIEGKARWIHCTPLTGSDGKVGVIMIIMVDKQELTNSLSSAVSKLSTSTPTAARLVSPAPPPRARARSHASFRDSEPAPERYQPRSTPSSASNSGPSSRGGSLDVPRLRSMGGSRLYADYMKEIREAQKRVDSFSTRSREHDEYAAGLGSMATAVAVKAVNGKGRLKRTGATF